MTRKKKMVTYDQAKPTSKQHRSPCCDCPFARDSFPGWLAGHSPEDYVMQAHGEVQIDCHTKIGPQCTGAAIYRANIIKRCRDKAILSLEQDKENVFATPMEFIEHHSRKAR